MDHAYLELKLAWQAYKMGPEKLDEHARGRVRAMARRQSQIEHRILGSREAMGVVVPPNLNAARMDEIRARYTDTSEFHADLERAGLDLSGLEASIARDVLIEHTLERVASGVPAVTDVEAEIFFHLHPDHFRRPETRTFRHILLTFNSHSEQAAVRTKLGQLREECGDVDSFSRAAMRYSHCPTSLEGGKLGTMPRGQLFPVLDEAGFQLESGALSAVTESPVGMHLLRCDAIFPQQTVPFTSIRERLKAVLNSRRLERAKQAWLRALEEAVQQRAVSAQ